MDPNTLENRLDEAVAARLAKLRAMPVDTSRLERMIQQQIPRPTPQPSIIFRMRPLRAVAAGLFVIVLAGVVLFSLSGGAALASPDTMAQFHHDLVSGKVTAVKVDSISEANQTLASQWKHGVEIPQVPTEHVMMCCMREVDDKRVACVLLDNDGVPVTMAVARAMDMKMPKGQLLVRDGIRYHVQTSSSLNMVMTEREGRWVCLIGALAADRLIDLATGIEF